MRTPGLPSSQLSNQLHCVNLRCLTSLDTDFLICKTGWEEKTRTGSDFYLCSQSTGVLGGTSGSLTAGGVGSKGGVKWTVPYPTPEKLYFLLSTVSGTKMSLGFQYDPNLHPDHQGEAPGLDTKNLVP